MNKFMARRLRKPRVDRTRVSRNLNGVNYILVRQLPRLDLRDKMLNCVFGLFSYTTRNVGEQPTNYTVRHPLSREVRINNGAAR